MSADNGDLQRKIVEVLNEEIGSDLKHLSKLKDLYVETRTVQENLKEKLSLISSEAPTKIQSALQDVQVFCERLSNLEQEFSELEIHSSDHLEKSRLFLTKLVDKLNLVDKVEHQKYYLECIKVIEIIGDKLQHCVQSNQDTEAVQLYNDMVEFSHLFQSSSCTHLVHYMNQSTQFWFDLLKGKLRKELQESLKLIQWPLISSNQEVLKAPPSSDVMTKFQLQFRSLSSLKAPPSHEESIPKTVDHPILSRFSTPSRAVEELLNPLQKRFAYHFSGNRPTNRRDKPEWYLRQVLQWIGDHVKFIETHVRSIYGDGDALLEFNRGLVQLAVEKLNKESALILEDNALLAHTIGEVLSFETDLRSSFDYPSSQPSPLLILTQPHFFSRWIDLEKAFAVEKMDVLLSSDKAWSSVSGYENTGDDDGVRLTQCAEGFLQMLLAITDRYKTLPQPGHRLQFLDLQLDLLDEFRIRLLQLARQDAYLDLQVLAKNSSSICAILNTVSAVVNVLTDWSDLPFFLQLYTYKVQTENKERLAAQILNDSDGSQLPWLRTQTHHSADEVTEGSVFDNIVDLLKRMQEDLLHKVVEAVMLEVKARSQPYRLDKWASLPSPDAFIQLSLSPTGSAMLQAVALGLQWLQDSLASPLFRDSWQNLASQINEFLFEELILQRQFNDGGTAQLCFDIQQNLIPLFSQFTSRPESYFRELKDACTLLRLPRPIHLLLVDTLVQCVQIDTNALSAKSSRAIASGRDALKDQGVTKLGMEDALSVLRRRIL